MRRRPGAYGDVRRLIVRDGAIFQRYTVTGQLLEAEKSSSFYGSILPSPALHHPALACAVRQSKLSREQLLTISQGGIAIMISIGRGLACGRCM